jgi:hypothetical protein
VPNAQNPVSNADTTRRQNDGMSEERPSVQPMWRSVLMVALATYLPFIWLLAYPILLLALGGPLIPGFVAAQFLLGPGASPLVWLVSTVLILTFFTWLGRRSYGVRTVALGCAFALSLLESIAVAFIFTHFHT